jgi:nicotinate-nucleotide adenylyltransferase
MTRSVRKRKPVLGVLGGAFDPPHIGHVLTVTYVRSRGLVDRVVVAPCWEHPLGKQPSPFADRLAWTRAAMAVHGSDVEVSDMERGLAEERGGPSYTIALLEALAREHPDHEVRLVIGSDIEATGEVARWYRWPDIRANFAPLVVPRAGYAPTDVAALPDVSSTRIREWLRSPDVPGARKRLCEALPAAVLRLVLEPEKGEVWLVGRGNVAAHAEPWLAAGGFEVRLLGARALAEGRTKLPSTTPRGIWLVCRDADLATVACALSDRAKLRRDIPVLHAAGALRARRPDALGSLADRGHSVGTLHPVCSLRRDHLAGSLLGRAAFGIEGDAGAREFARELVGEQPWLDLEDLDDGGRLAYHAACALAANHLAVLMDAAAGSMVGQELPRATVEEALSVLLQSALDNLLALGVPRGVTGPVVRGDQALVDAHADALEPEASALYRLLSASLSRIVASGQ